MSTTVRSVTTTPMIPRNPVSPRRPEFTRGTQDLDHCRRFLMMWRDDSSAVNYDTTTITHGEFVDHYMNRNRRATDEFEALDVGQKTKTKPKAVQSSGADPP